MVNDSSHTDSQCWERCVWHMANSGENILQERATGKVNAKDLRYLIEDDHEADARAEANKYRLGDEVGYRSKVQDAGKQ